MFFDERDHDAWYGPFYLGGPLQTPASSRILPRGWTHALERGADAKSRNQDSKVTRNR